MTEEIIWEAGMKVFVWAKIWERKGKKLIRRKQTIKGKGRQK